MKTECMKCEEIIPQAEFDKNEGLCDKCYARSKLLQELNDKVLYPTNQLSYPERMDTPVELDMTIGEWVQLLEGGK